jgi:DNA-directed RNA polymerase subunit RPC12/RpoP
MRASFIVQLKQLAADVAHVAQSRIEQLKKEIEEAEQLKKKAQAELDMAKAAASQADTFEPEVGATYRCPYCWVRRDIRSALKRIPSNESNMDRFRCVTCDAEIALEV